jgi:carbamoylphosphate synthase small subunit
MNTTASTADATADLAHIDTRKLVRLVRDRATMHRRAR